MAVCDSWFCDATLEQHVIYLDLMCVFPEKLKHTVFSVLSYQSILFTDPNVGQQDSVKSGIKCFFQQVSQSSKWVSDLQEYADE